jgi:glyoxylase-like metal-dependent hydrolase (beta-lactamase superfamily II)
MAWGAYIHDMTAYRSITRRVLLKDMGKAGLAVVVLGAAACAAPENEATTTTSRSNSTSTTSPPINTTTIAASTTTPAVTGGIGLPGHQWQRVNMGIVSAYILYRDGEAAVIDTGLANSQQAIEDALTTAGLGWDSVGHAIVTHRHEDHARGLPEVMSLAPDAAWYAGEEDMQFITAQLSGTIVRDAEKVFDLTIFTTPGHTPGHISVLDEVSGILVAGDALRTSDGELRQPNPQFTMVMDVANESIAKLATFDYEIVLVGHGEPVTTGGSAAVAELAATLG